MKNQRRIQSLLRRHLAASNKGKSHFDKAGIFLATAVDCGLAPGQPVEVEVAQGQVERFHLVDNADEISAKGAIYRPARFPRLELKKVPKNPRPARPDQTEDAAS